MKRRPRDGEAFFLDTDVNCPKHYADDLFKIRTSRFPDLIGDRMRTGYIPLFIVTKACAFAVPDQVGEQVRFYI